MITSRFPELSFRKNRPIIEPKDLPAKPKCKAMDKEWKEAISDKYWATTYTGMLKEAVPCGLKKHSKEIQIALQMQLKLRDRILTFGGEEVCMPSVEEDLILLVAHGEIWLPKGAVMKRGEPSRCHENSARLWDVNRGKVSIATGYYLSNDGMWRAHSWCILSNTRGGRIVETTHKGLLYFGVVLNTEEAEKRLDNYW